eukprot:gene15639-21144_t
MCPRSENGELICPKNSTHDWSDYTEGDAEHWRFSTPHDINGLIDLFPDGKNEFENTLLNFFQKHISFHEKFGEAVPNPYYWAGNEVDILTPYYFNYVNCTYTHYWTRKTFDMHYNSHPNGIPGNDDYGTMSANIIFTALGFYPLSGSDIFLLGSPKVNHAFINNSKMKIEIIVYNNSNDNVYVNKVFYNGIALKSPFLKASLLYQQHGGRFEYFMSSQPKSELCPSY